MLRKIIETHKLLYGKPLKDLTVLSAQRDPYRLDTPANHAIGQWAQAAWEGTHNGTVIHLRGFHYKLVGRVNKPDGSPYTNTDENWLWLSEKVMKAARYLGYIPWSRIRDARNSSPQIYTPEDIRPYWSLQAGEVLVDLPDKLEPRFEIRGIMHRQPWRQVVVAEKQGVEGLLLPVCRRREATLCLPGGEISDTLVYDLLRAADEDGRPVVFHSLGDCDPAGYQMAVSLGRKIQALIDSQFPEVTARVHAPALTPDQCNAWDLPSTPLKPGEKRADRWMEFTGREQTELDAAVALAPQELVRVVESSMLQYYDPEASSRGWERREELEAKANEYLQGQLNQETLQAIREDAETKLEELESLVHQVNSALDISYEDLAIEDPDPVEQVIGETDERQAYLIDTDDPWLQNTSALIRRKQYKGTPNEN